VLNLIQWLESYTANLCALDRQRHNGVGLKRLGFIEAVFRLSSKFPQYFPHWLDTEKFLNDLDLFNAIRSLVEVCRTLEEKAWNINAESIYNELYAFFRRGPMESDLGKAAPTEKKVKRDVNALLKGKKGGEVIIKTSNPNTPNSRLFT